MPIRTDPAARPVAVDATVIGAPLQHSARPLAPSAPSGRSVAPSLPAVRSAARPAPRRPDPTPARLAVAAGGIATVSALLAAIAGGAVPATAAAAPNADSAALPGPVQTIVKYVYVQPGQATPNAAVATVVPTPRPRPRPAPVVTSQSGAKP